MASKLLSPSEAKTNKAAILFTYRALLRATYVAFKGDDTTLKASRTFARDQFQSSRSLQSGSSEAGAALQHAQGVIHILRKNIVQGQHMGDDKYKLKIHEDTERGDNATAKKMQGSVKSFKDIKNSVF